MSSSATAAQKNLILRMLNHADEEAFGIEGTPPEMSIYLSLMKGCGLHASKRGTWGLVEPPNDTTTSGHVGPAWHGIATFLNKRAGTRLPLMELYGAIRAAPYGIKRGVSPILFAHFFALRGAEVALYKEGVFVPRLTLAVVEQLLRRPKKFEVQYHPTSESRTKAVRSLAKALAVSGKRKGADPSPLDLVRVMVRTVYALSEYALRTLHVSSPPSRCAPRLLRRRACGPAVPRCRDVGLLALGTDTVLKPKQPSSLGCRCRARSGATGPIAVGRIETTICAAFGLRTSQERTVEQITCGQRVFSMQRHPSFGLFGPCR